MPLWFSALHNIISETFYDLCIFQFTIGGSGDDGDYVALSDTCVFTSTNTFCEFHIDIVDDFNAEMDESFNILLRSSDTSACRVDDDNITVTIIDDG